MDTDNIIKDYEKILCKKTQDFVKEKKGLNAEVELYSALTDLEIETLEDIKEWLSFISDNKKSGSYLMLVAEKDPESIFFNLQKDNLPIFVGDALHWIVGIAELIKE